MTKYQGIVTTAELSAPIKEVEITRINSDGNIVEVSYSNSKGEWVCSDFQEGDRIIFFYKGFVKKQYILQPLPTVVRLLEDSLIGYQDKLWFSPGESISAYIHSPNSFSAKLCRHGFHKEVVSYIGDFDSYQQNVPDGFFVESGLSWVPTFSYSIPTNVKPGLYSLLLESDNQHKFAIPFIVSTPETNYGKDSKLLVLASTNTWQSYNLWGGRSRYRNFEEGCSSDFMDKNRLNLKQIFKYLFRFLPFSIKSFVKQTILKKVVLSSTDHWFFKKLTIKRPFTNCDLEMDYVCRPFINHLGGAEWRVLAWLERENINYDVISGAELHNNPSLLKNYQALLLSTHSEYWTREMYQGLKFYHEQKGLWVINISGNSIYREIEFYQDGSTRCVSLSFQQSCEDETQIVGVRFTEVDYGTCAPYQIVAPEHWVFSSLPDPASNSKNMKFGGLSLNQNTVKKTYRYDPGRPGLENGLEGMGASGWETDKLSKTAPKSTKIVAKGLNNGGGADMVVRDPGTTRGGMFSASSIVFGGCLLIDEVASTIVKNVIYKSLKQ